MRERTRRRPEAVPVELAHVASSALGRVQFRCQVVGLTALAHEVVGRHPQLARWRRRYASGLIGLGEQRQNAVEEHLALDEPGEAQPQVLDRAAAEVAARRRTT